MTKIGKKFKDSQWKAVAKLDETYEELALPEVTICLSNPYKSDNFEDSLLLKENFLANIYEQSEVVVEIGTHASVENSKVGLLSNYFRLFELSHIFKYQIIMLACLLTSGFFIILRALFPTCSLIFSDCFYHSASYSV